MIFIMGGQRIGKRIGYYRSGWKAGRLRRPHWSGGSEALIDRDEFNKAQRLKRAQAGFRL